MHFVIKEYYSPNDQHPGNWSMKQLYYQVSFVGHNGLIDPSSENMIVNGAVVLQLVTNASRKEIFCYACTA